jgi:hypothetical protein
MQPSLQPVEPLDMRQFDPRAGYDQVAPLLGTFGSERRNQIFRNYVDHVDAESRGDYDALMATCSRRRQWYVNPFGSAAQNAGQPQSYAELEVHYRRLVESNTYLIHRRRLDKLIVGDDQLFLDGVMHQLYPGRALVERGMEADPSTVYQLTARVCVVFLFDEDGMGMGEHGYSCGIGRDSYTPVADELVPEVFWHNPLTGPFRL